jgi:hypothetical protein
MTTPRLAGVAGLLFAGGVLLQNGVLLQGAPLPGASLDAITDFYTGRQSPVSAAVGWVAINVPLLLLFGAGVAERIERHAPSAVYGRAGFGGVVLLAAAFVSTTWLQATLAARVTDLAAAGQLRLVWDLHTAAFTTSATALCVAMGAFSLGAWGSGAVPRWCAGLGLAGAFSLGVSGILAVSTITGGPGIFFQLGGFGAWVVWLLTASIGLVREARSGSRA